MMAFEHRLASSKATKAWMHGGVDGRMIGWKDGVGVFYTWPGGVLHTHTVAFALRQAIREETATIL